MPREKTNTRPWVCILFPDGPSLKIVHRIEAFILQHIPGDTIPYSTRAEFEAALSAAFSRALPRGGKIAADYSSTIPVGSYLDHGTALLLQSLGASLAPAEGLVSRSLGALDDEGRRSHESAAKVLSGAVASAWSRLTAELGAGRTITEGDVQEWVMDSLSAGGLESDAPPIGAGRHTSDPHFAVEGRGAALEQGDLVQFDVWAKEKTAGAVYADISWVGVLCAVSHSTAGLPLCRGADAREAAVSLLQRRLTDGAPVTGAEWTARRARCSKAADSRAASVTGRGTPSERACTATA